MSSYLWEARGRVFGAFIRMPLHFVMAPPLWPPLSWGIEPLRALSLQITIGFNPDFGRFFLVNPNNSAADMPEPFPDQFSVAQLAD